MKKKQRAAADAAYIRKHIVFPVAVIFALLGAGVILLVISLGPDPLLDVSDADLISAAEESAEAQAFLRRYPAAVPAIDRSGRVAVDYRASSARLRLFLERGPRVTGAFLECPGRPQINTSVAEAARAGCF